MSYNTGGKVPGKGGTLLPGEGAQGCDIGSASVGTSNGPNVGPGPAPGGKGSTGTASDSNPS